MTEYKHLNVSLLESYIDTLGTSVVLQMLDLYIKQSEIYLQDISNAINVNEPLAWQKNCHKMKGAAGSVGLIQVHEKLVLIEKSIEEKKEKKAFVAELYLLNKAGIACLGHWLKN